MGQKGRFHTIAIGASAGGLQALQSFLSHLPKLDHACVIIAQHLSPTHKSRLVDLLSKSTDLKVITAKNGTALSDNTVYITPPDHHITVTKGKIRLIQAKKEITPKPSVNTLFESLSEGSPEQTIGIILSGTGSDGAMGVSALKAAGAHILAQEPETAKYDGMPLAAIRTGDVDGVFSPEKMGEEILDFIKNPKRVVLPKKNDPLETSYYKILNLLNERSGIDFTSYKSATIGRRLDKQMTSVNAESLDEYWKYIKEEPKEVDRLFQTILIGVTSFFRDKEAFGLIREKLHALLQEKNEGDKIRIWVAGCSTGQEAYSYAILLHKLLGDDIHKYQVQIFATDIDKKALEIARTGIYEIETLNSLDDDILKTYFKKTEDGFQIQKSVRNLVLFSNHNLLSNPPFLNQDLISCRNLLIYFDASLQKKVIPLFHYALNEHGLLILGKSETVGHFNNLFTTIDGKNKLYKRKYSSVNNHPLNFSTYSNNFIRKRENDAHSIDTEKLTIEDKVKETLYNTYEHPFVVVDNNLEIIEVFGDLRLFLTLPSGKMGQNLIEMVNEELKIDLRDISLKAVKHQASHSSRIRQFELFEKKYYVRLTIKPVLYSSDSDPLFMVMFEKLDIGTFISYENKEGASDTDERNYQDLKQELDKTKEQLQTYIEELETSNEELQALNEEFQSTNEELNSTNEELETSNEELQSTNEEVQVAYSELQATNKKLNEKEDSLKKERKNLQAMLNNRLQGFILVQRNFEIELFNKKAADIFQNLINKNLSKQKSILEYLPEVEIDAFLKHFKTALEGESYSGEQELTNINGEKIWFSLNYTPVMYEEGEVSAISIAINDITELKKTLTDLDESERLINSLFDATLLGISITDEDGIFVDANQTYCDIYGYDKGEIIGRHFTMMIPSRMRDEMQQLHDGFINGTAEAPGEFLVANKKGEELRVAFQAQRLIRADGSVNKVTSIRDITQEALHQRQVDVISSNLPGVLLQYVLYKDDSDALLSVSTRSKYLWGIDSDKLIKNNNLYWERTHPDDIEYVSKSIRLSARKMETWQCEWRYNHPDGSVRWHQGTGEPRISQNHEVDTIWDSVILDITESKVHEEQRILLESAVKKSDDAIIVTEAKNQPNGWPKVVFVNEAFTRITGYLWDDIVGKTPELLRGPKTNYDELMELDEVSKNWVPFEKTTVNYKKNGEAYWVSYKLSPILDTNGKHTHWVIIQRDVTNQKNNELQRELLVEVGKIFSEGLNFKSTLDKITEHIALFGGFDVAELWLVDKEKDEIQLYSKNTIEDQYAVFHGDTEVHSFKKNEGLPGKVWHDKETILIRDLQSNEFFVRKEEAKKSGITSVFGVPIFHHNTVIAVIILGRASEISALSEDNILLENFQHNLGSDILRKQLEEEMLIIYDTSPDIICIAGFDGYFKRINKAAVDILGYSVEKLTSVPYSEFIHPEDLNATSDIETSIRKGVHVKYFENRFITADGEIIWLAWTSTIDTESELMYGVAKDITETKRVQHLLNEATNLANIGAWELDLPGHTIYWSPNTCAIHGVNEDYVPDFETAVNFFKEGTHRQNITSALENVINHNEPYDLEGIIITKDGQEKWIRTIGKPEIINNAVVKLTGSIQDIHEKKVAEINAIEALREKETILESIGDAFFSVDRNWTVTYWNKMSEVLLGVGKEQVEGENLWEVFPDALKDVYYEKYNDAFNSGKPVHFQTYFNTLGIWLDISAYPDNDILSVYFKDITEQKLSENKLKISNERFDLVTKATQDAIWDWDLEKDQMFWGGAFATLLNIDLKETTPSHKLWESFIHPDDLSRYEQSLNKILNDAQTDTMQIEYRIQPDNEEYRHIVDRGIIMRNEDNKPFRMVGAITDLTEQKEYQAELERINKKLDARARELSISNSELEQFAYVASHDLQEPLRMVTSFLTQLEKKYKDQLDEKALTYINFAVDGGKRMRRIILDLLEFSRVGKYQDDPNDIDLNHIVDEAIKLHHRAIESSQATVTVTDTLPTIKGHRSPVLQLFQNLIGNALKYCSDNVKPEITISVTSINNHYQFTVKDNGIGIDSKYHDKIFVIFQRLHSRDEYSGTGMGLAIVKKIIDSFGGKIWLESEVGKGSAFYFTLPKKFINETD